MYVDGVDGQTDVDPPLRGLKNLSTRRLLFGLSVYAQF